MESTIFEEPSLPIDMEESANPEQLQQSTSPSDASPESPSSNQGYKSSTLPGGMSHISPLRARTMKEYDQQIGDLKKENFNLKLRIYYLEEKMTQKYGASNDHLQIYKSNLELKVENASLKKDLGDKVQLLAEASGAIEAMEKQQKAKYDELQEASMKQKHKLEERIEAITKKLQNSSLLSQENEGRNTDSLLRDKNQLIMKLNKELDTVKEQSLKRNKTIQGLAEVVKIKEIENIKLQKQIKQLDSHDIEPANTCEHDLNVSELKRALDSVQEEVKKSSDAHKKVVREKDNAIADLQKSVGDLQQLLQTKIENAEHNEAVLKYENEISNLKHVIQDKNMQLEELKCEKKLSEDEKDERLIGLQDKMTALKQQLEESAEQCKLCSENCTKKEDELKSLSVVLAAKEKEISHLKNNLDKATDNFVEVQQKIDQSKFELKKIEGGYETKIIGLNRNVDNLHGELESVKDNLKRSKNENEMLNMLLKEKEKALKQSESDKLALEDKCTTLLAKGALLHSNNDKSISALEIGADVALVKSKEAENKVERLTEKLTIAEDTIYAQNRKISCFLKLLSNAGIDPLSANDTTNVDLSRIGTPPQKLQETYSTTMNSSSFFEQVNDSKIGSRYSKPDQLSAFIASLKAKPITNCSEHKAEIEDLRSRLTKALDCYEMLECRLQEIADFLERVLNYDKYNGQLTPQQITNIRSYLSESRDISHSLSMSLLGNMPQDESVYDKSNNSMLHLSPHSIEHCRNVEMTLQEDNIDSLKMSQSQPLIIHTEDVFKKPFPKTRSQSDSLPANYPVTQEQQRIVRGDSASDSDVWSEPDRNVSLQRIGLDSSVLKPMNQSAHINCFSTSDSNTATEVPLTSSASFNGSGQSENVIGQLRAKLTSLHQLNESLKGELAIYRDLSQKKMSRWDENSMPEFFVKHLEAIRALHEKLENNQFQQQAFTMPDHTKTNDLENTEKKELQEELAKCRSKIAVQERNFAQVCSANSDLQEKYIKKCQEIDSERSQLLEAQKQTVEYDKMVKTLQMANENFQRRSEKLMGQVANCDNLQKNNSSLQLQVEALQTKIADFEAAIIAREQEVKQVQDWNLRLQAEVKAKETLANSSNSERDQFKIELQKKLKVLQEVQLSFAELQNLLKGKDDSIRVLQKECDQYKNHAEQVESLSSELEIFKRNLENETALVKRLETEKMDLQAKLLKFYSDVSSADELPSSDKRSSYPTSRSNSRGTSTESSKSFTHIKRPLPLTSLATDELSSRVTNFLDAKNKCRLSVNSNQKNEESSCSEDTLKRSTIHYSSPDLGIESDLNKENELNSKRLSKGVNLQTKELQDVILDDKDGHLYVMIPLLQYEVLKKVGMESANILAVMQARFKDITANPSLAEVKCGIVKQLSVSCTNMEACLEKSISLLLSFPIFDISTLRQNLQESSDQLRDKNKMLEDKLRAVQDLHDKKEQKMEDALKELSIAQKKKHVIEKVVTKQLRKTNQVLKKAKTNLEKPNS